MIFIEWKNLFEIVPRQHPPVILAARSYEEKSNWMGALVMLTTKRSVLQKWSKDKEAIF